MPRPEVNPGGEIAFCFRIRCSPLLSARTRIFSINRKAHSSPCSKPPTMEELLFTSDPSRLPIRFPLMCCKVPVRSRRVIGCDPSHTRSAREGSRSMESSPLSLRFRDSTPLRSSMAHFCTIGGMGRPVDVANIAEFFASELCSFVSGQLLYVTGGGSA
jgi:hypothetical protein